MKLHTVKIDESVLSFRIYAEGNRADLENEGQGMCSFGIKLGDIRRVIPKGFQFSQVNGMQNETLSYLAESMCEREGWDDDDIRDESLSTTDEVVMDCGDADACIMFMALAIAQGIHLTMDWHSEGSAFWLLHDIEHARTDTWIDLDYGEGGTGGIGELEGSDEERALVNAALQAIKTGTVSTPEVLREIIDNAKAFEDRFDYEATILEDVLENCVLTLTTKETA